ncbi:hypothetical protein DPEC_G00299580 [Dallia pectoralis]|uniref:Uncharacterized protein n=1 Tax=Dallia pectoralis TaxID=75939 RepID=A0ACC2FG96_DALPE|nr:hypothetical protein DPEC_G00299580 [Dallia pectoralis]
MWPDVLTGNVRSARAHCHFPVSRPVARLGDGRFERERGGTGGDGDSRGRSLHTSSWDGGRQTALIDHERYLWSAGTPCQFEDGESQDSRVRSCLSPLGTR